jgi:hypothetical protein
LPEAILAIDGNSACRLGALFKQYYGDDPRLAAKASSLPLVLRSRLSYADLQSTAHILYATFIKVPFLKLDYQLSGEIDIGISHSLYNQANQYSLTACLQ